MICLGGFGGGVQLPVHFSPVIKGCARACSGVNLSSGSIFNKQYKKWIKGIRRAFSKYQKKKKIY